MKSDAAIIVARREATKAVITDSFVGIWLFEATNTPSDVITHTAFTGSIFVRVV